MQDWMEALAGHYRHTRATYPKHRLMILFDIDGTILDSRYTLLYLLKGFDRIHHSAYFRNLQLSDIDVEFDGLNTLIGRYLPSAQIGNKVAAWVCMNRESALAVFEAHRPHRGVLEIIRWFQLQPGTHVGINSSRISSCRTNTLESLNHLGEEYRVHFSDEFLYLQPAGDLTSGMRGKVSGVRHFQKQGYRIFAVVDDRKVNLDAIAAIDADNEILRLHASAVFRSQRGTTADTTPPSAPWIERNSPGFRPDHDAVAKLLSGHRYELAPLVRESELPRHVEFVWAGLNSEARLERFLSSNVRWASLEILNDPLTDTPRLAARGLLATPLARILRELLSHHRGVRLDLKPGFTALSRLIGILQNQGAEDRELWLCGSLEQLREDGFKILRAAFPRAILECPVDFMTPLILGSPRKAEEILDMLSEWGINRVSLSCRITELSRLIDCLDEWGFDTHVRDVPSLDCFLRTVLLLPRSIAADFAFATNYFNQAQATPTVEPLRLPRHETFASLPH